MTELQVLWFLLVGFLLTVYAVLDGFDLGVGFWSFFVKKDEEKRALLNAIGPFWDGNEVWLLTGAGALFAAFPPVYATVFSGFYLALMIVLFSLIFRAVAVEFRSKLESPGWRKRWDLAFALGSSLPALLFGVALGNVMRGVPLENGEFAGNFFTLLNPYSLLIGLTGFFMILTHGAVYITLKTDGELARRAGKWAKASSVIFLLLVLAASAWTIAGQPRLMQNFKSFPLWFAVPALAVIAIVLVNRFVAADKPGKAFVASCIAIAALMGTAGIGLYPHLLPALDGAAGLTIFNASSSKLTLTVMAILALIGMPFVVGYTIWIYRTFGGKVESGHAAY